jgi:hypothetical protein
MIGSRYEYIAGILTLRAERDDTQPQRTAPDQSWFYDGRLGGLLEPRRCRVLVEALPMNSSAYMAAATFGSKTDATNSSMAA